MANPIALPDPLFSSERYHEVNLAPLFIQRHRLVAHVPDFWSSIFLNPPDSLAQYLTEDDYDLLQYVTKFFVERYEISEDGESGEPRSTRITFEFAPNHIIENTELTKTLEYRRSRDGRFEGYSSEPVHIRWKSRHVDLTEGLGQKAWLLWQAEKAIQQYPFDDVGKKLTREDLFQHDRLIDGIEEKACSSQPQVSFFGLFYYRGLDQSELGDELYGGARDMENGMMNAEMYPEGEHLADVLSEIIWVEALNLHSKLTYQ